MASDTSYLGLGAVLLHRKKDGQLKVVHYASRTLLPAEINYSRIKKEGLGLIFAVKKFHKYILRGEFKLTVALYCPYSAQKGIPTHSANRLERWGTILLNYSFKMEFLPFKKIPYTDGLSRLIPKIREPLEEAVIASLISKMDNKTFF